MEHVIAVWMPTSIGGRVLTANARNKLERLGRVMYVSEETMTKSGSVKLLKEATAAITCWGSLPLDEELLEKAPVLGLIAHAAGSVKSICSKGVWNRGIRVTSAAAANAQSVAEHTLGMMIALLKRSFWLNECFHNRLPYHEEYDRSVALYEITVGIVGAGHIGKYMIQLLKTFQVDILLYDPTITTEKAEQLGVRKAVTLEELMSESHVVSLHAPELPATRHMIHGGNLPLMRDNALLINTARGSLIDENALITELRRGRITAYLDVFQEEPLPAHSHLRELPNAILTPHNAGALFNDLPRMGDLAVKEVERYISGLPPLFPIVYENLDTIA